MAKSVFEIALVHHRAGNVAEAERLYRQTAAEEPRHYNAIYCLGLLLLDQGRFTEAADFISRALALNSGLPGAHGALADALKKSGRIDEAIAKYRQAISASPSDLALKEKLAGTLVARGQFSEAANLYRQALLLNPDSPELHNNLGIALKSQGNLDEAIASYREAVARRQNFPEAHYNLGIALSAAGHVEHAIESFRRAIALRPGMAQAYNNLGNCLLEKRSVEEAIAAYSKAIDLAPNYLDPEINLGNALRDCGRYDDAIAVNRKAVAIDPQSADAHTNLAMALLTRGDMPEGWQEYEWRSDSSAFRSTIRKFPQPLWDGSILRDKTILLHSEQGFGDAIQFIRYLNLVAQKCENIVILCPKELNRLFRSITAKFPIYCTGDALPQFEFQCPLLSLPRLFGTSLSNIPNDVPYLWADAADVGKWRQRIEDAELKVGVAWAGGRAHKNDRARSVSMEMLAPLWSMTNVRFFSLQKDQRFDNTPLESTLLVDWTGDLRDFADTAALVSCLDLIITVDTAVAHLAGALGKPVWVLLPFVPDWRWMLDRDDSPWYPTIHLFRQRILGNWTEVIERMMASLAELIRIRTTEHSD